MSPMSPRLLRPRLSGSWTPARIGSSLALWLDASDASQIVLNGSNVSQWKDKSGNGRDFSQTSDATFQPVYVTGGSGINGLAAIQFDGINDRLQRTADSWAYGYPVNIFCVFNATSLGAAYNGMFGFYSSGHGGGAVNAAGYGAFIKSNGKSAIYAVADSAQPNYDGNGAATYSTATTNVFAATIGDNSIQSWGNGTADGINSGTWTLRVNAGVQPVSLGSDPGFNRFTNWKIGEALIVTGSAMTASLRQQIEGYLAWKWGSTSSLPSTHPYKTTRP